MFRNPPSLREVALPTLIGVALWLAVTVVAMSALKISSEGEAQHIFFGIQ